MLISKAPDEDEDKAVECTSTTIDDSNEYQTASELFEFMAKNQNFSSNDISALTPRDLVLLYKNIDLSAKLISNRRVETIVYGDDPESDCSDISEVYSNEDLQNIILINKEQIDFLNNPSSIENKLCQKLGDLELQTSISTDYDKHFLFKDPYIKEQLKGFNLLSNNNEMEASVLPASLLDYVCCKRLEDNYNFYMDNIIRYVKNTIDQLKRISNGDYLTDKVKEKWREVEHAEDTCHDNTKVLATSTSIPLHVECKSGGLKSTWDDIVHSAVDVRSLSKILEKKIIVEIPKLINGSYTLLSKCCADNLIISCKKDYQRAKDYKKSRVDVVLQLKRSETGHVVSQISSIMFLQSAPPIQEQHKTVAPLPLVYKEIEKAASIIKKHESGVKIVELDTSIQEIDEVQDTSVIDDDEECFEDSDSFDFQPNPCNTSLYSSSQDDTTESSSTFNTNVDGVKRYVQKEASFDVCPDDLRMTIQRLATQSALPEESIEDVSQLTVTKKRSPMRIRIKSPYQNQSHILEEKKRKKLLEIRERRERKKMALAENCKITKHKYGKGAVMPQASSSVTKLSITNKSFYNSIYGHTDTKINLKQTNNKSRIKDEPKEGFQEVLENLEIPQENPELSPTNTKKFINRSYYLDDTVTEMMYMKMKQQQKDILSETTSGVSSDFRSNFNRLSPLNGPFECDLNELDEIPHPPATPKHLLVGPSDSEGQECHSKEIAASRSTLNIVPANTPKPATRTDSEKNDNKKVMPSVECRKSIDKIYELVKKLGKNQSSRSKPQSIFSTKTCNAVIGSVERGSFLVQESDSGTSLKPIVSPSYPSSFSFSKKNSTEALITYDKKPVSTTTVTKVIISSKSQIPIPKTEIPKTDITKTKDHKRSGVNSVNKALDTNPLHAISQLLREFDNVQKKRIKPGTEQKPASKIDASNDGKSMSRQDTNKKRSRYEQHSDFIDKYASRATTSKDKRIRAIAGSEGLKIPYQQVPVDDKTADKTGKKKIMEILDEAKEARGEAVRGPSKFTSRLNSLAQPKRTYVQAHSEEYQTRYGRNLITDRLQRLASAPSPLVTERGARIANTRSKIKRSSNEADYTMSLKQPVPMGFPIERSGRPKRPRNNSPILKERVTTGGGSIHKHIPVEKPEALNKKMVAVESYVKNHYGLDSRISQKSRAPLIPNDINIALAPSSTLLESSEVGNNLHRIIESMMSTTSHGLDVLTECLETNSRSSRDHSDDVFYSPRCDEGISIDSDYTSGSDDSHLMNVDKKKQRRTNIGQTDCKHEPMQPYQSVTMLKNLDLNSRLSLGAFSKHLKINNIAVTPKSSIQKLFLLQSGDAGSLVVNTHSSVSHTEKLLKLKRMPALSSTHWNLRFPSIPMQITTVGYAFPEYNSALPAPKQLLEDLTKSSHKATCVSHNGVNKYLSVDETYANHQRCKNEKFHARLEQAAQGDMMNVEAESRSNEKQEQASFILSKNTSKSISIQAITNEEEIKTNRNETKITQTVTFEEKCTSDVTVNKPAEVEYTTSLDILVGLLNEIQKITTCQTHITINESEECNELEMLLNKSTALDSSIESPYNNVSITSLDKLRCLDSNPSLYSFYISDGGEPNRNINIRPNIDPWYEIKNNAYHTTIYVDKEVNVDIIDKKCVNTLTDVPSVVFPITINHSTNMTNTLVEEFCQSSIQSLLTFTDYHATYSNALCVQSTHFDDSSKKVIELLPQIKNTPQDSNQYIEDHRKVKETNKAKLIVKRQARSLIKDASIKSNVKPRNNYCLKNSDFDPVMKLKRDILVTVYSMLVLTVFAALSFPEVLYHVL